MQCLATRSMPFRKARSVNQTSASYVAKAPTATEPSGDAGTATGASVIDLSNPRVGGEAQNAACVVFFGVGSDNNTFNCRVIGWRSVGFDVNGETGLWVPVPLLAVTATLSTVVGVAGRVIVATERFADTIAISGNTANDDVNVSIVSPANDTIAHLVVDLSGFVKVEFSFETGSSATSCNALVALL